MHGYSRYVDMMVCISCCTTRHHQNVTLSFALKSLAFSAYIINCIHRLILSIRTDASSKMNNGIELTPQHATLEILRGVKLHQSGRREPPKPNMGNKSVARTDHTTPKYGRVIFLLPSIYDPSRSPSKYIK